MTQGIRHISYPLVGRQRVRKQTLTPSALLSARAATFPPDRSHVAGCPIVSRPVTTAATAGKVVVNVPSWTGTELRNKLQASKAAAASGFGPRLLAEVRYK
eukprot:SAG11_NODE_1208_length_5521_cov_4.088528_6_plen_101_part_00